MRVTLTLLLLQEVGIVIITLKIDITHEKLTQLELAGEFNFHLVCSIYFNLLGFSFVATVFNPFLFQPGNALLAQSHVKKKWFS